jgi:hypothetical protein
MEARAVFNELPFVVREQCWEMALHAHIGAQDCRPHLMRLLLCCKVPTVVADVICDNVMRITEIEHPISPAYRVASQQRPRRRPVSGEPCMDGIVEFVRPHGRVAFLRADVALVAETIAPTSEQAPVTVYLKGGMALDLDDSTYDEVLRRLTWVTPAPTVPAVEVQDDSHSRKVRPGQVHRRAKKTT